MGRSEWGWRMALRHRMSTVGGPLTELAAARIGLTAGMVASTCLGCLVSCPHCHLRLFGFQAVSHRVLQPWGCDVPARLPACQPQRLPACLLPCRHGGAERANVHRAASLHPAFHHPAGALLAEKDPRLAHLECNGHHDWRCAETGQPRRTVALSLGTCPSRLTADEAGSGGA